LKEKTPEFEAVHCHSSFSVEQGTYSLVDFIR